MKKKFSTGKQTNGCSLEEKGKFTENVTKKVSQPPKSSFYQ